MAAAVALVQTGLKAAYPELLDNIRRVRAYSERKDHWIDKDHQWIDATEPHIVEHDGGYRYAYIIVTRDTEPWRMLSVSLPQRRAAMPKPILVLSVAYLFGFSRGRLSPAPNPFPAHWSITAHDGIAVVSEPALLRTLLHGQAPNESSTARPQ